MKKGRKGSCLYVRTIEILLFGVYAFDITLSSDNVSFGKNKHRASHLKL
jgi:hypothetical protein